jgi:hypothetical protein
MPLSFYTLPVLASAHCGVHETGYTSIPAAQLPRARRPGLASVMSYSYNLCVRHSSLVFALLVLQFKIARLPGSAHQVSKFSLIQPEKARCSGSEKTVSCRERQQRRGAPLPQRHKEQLGTAGAAVPRGKAVVAFLRLSEPGLLPFPTRLTA